ncbi:hypothetical protein TSAR_015281 [Trichomalopsis sarcophagae]|uniref:Uncharacterized protein n=1 Tax=Trichomalopsis sarcophagae TaxID=543379 RepID=A0A232EIP7_9HYME|nr:hypothetical protein TSAR_015281 [Trichomalopsis sarcophagae]
MEQSALKECISDKTTPLKEVTIDLSSTRLLDNFQNESTVNLPQQALPSTSATKLSARLENSVTDARKRDDDRVGPNTQNAKDKANESLESVLQEVNNEHSTQNKVNGEESTNPTEGTQSTSKMDSNKENARNVQNKSKKPIQPMSQDNSRNTNSKTKLNSTRVPHTQFSKDKKDYKTKYEKCIEEKEQLQNRINKLVDKVIEKFEEQQVIKDQLAETKDSTVTDSSNGNANFLPVGHYRQSDNTIK